MKKDYMVEFQVWNTKLRDYPIEIWDDGSIDIKTNGRDYLRLSRLDLQELLSKANDFVSARSKYKKKLDS